MQYRWSKVTDVEPDLGRWCKLSVKLERIDGMEAIPDGLEIQISGG